MNFLESVTFVEAAPSGVDAYEVRYADVARAASGDVVWRLDQAEEDWFNASRYQGRS